MTDKFWRITAEGDTTDQFFSETCPHVEKGDVIVEVSGSLKGKKFTAYLFQHVLRAIHVDEIDQLPERLAA